MELFLGMNEHEWSTHQPLIRTVVDLYKPNFVLELGIGHNSTPIFLEYGLDLLSVENDRDWIDEMIGKHENLDVIFHDLKDSDIKLGTHLNEITEGKKEEIIHFYNKLCFPNTKPNLLFVDQYTCCRTLSINALSPIFDMIIYHDCQFAGTTWYNYDLINVNGFKRYFLKCNSSWTCLMIKDDLDKGLADLRFIAEEHINNYIKKFPVIKYMEISNNY